MMNDNKIKQKFDEIYKAKIEPSLQELEKLRIEEKKKYDILYKILMITFLFAMIVGFLAQLVKLPSFVMHLFDVSIIFIPLLFYHTKRLLMITEKQ